MRTSNKKQSRGKETIAGRVRSGLQVARHLSYLRWRERNFERWRARRDVRNRVIALGVSIAQERAIRDAARERKMSAADLIRSVVFPLYVRAEDLTRSDFHFVEEVDGVVKAKAVGARK